jgi:TolA-binding protein
MSVAAWRRSSDAVVQDPVAAAPSQTDTAALARTVGQLLAADSDSAVETLRALSAYSRRWPAAAQRRAAEIGRQRGLVHFRAGEKAFREANWAQAARELSWAVTYGGGSDYHANAMYLLARTHARNAQPVSARIQAQEMLRQYPKSRYADAVMRRIASTGTER